MTTGLTYNVCWGLSLLEWETAKQVFGHPAPPNASWLKSSDTLFPVFAFLTGFQPITPRQSLYAIGIGAARNVLIRRPVSSLGGFQRIGLAGLLLDALQTSKPLPLLSVGCFYLLLRYIAALSSLKNVPESTNSKSPRRTKKHDLQASMGIASTAATMWAGYCVANGHLSTNDLFITGVSLISFGHLTSYTLPKLLSSTAAPWSPSSALIANGISLLNYTATSLGCRLLQYYNVGTPLLGVLGIVGSHALELYLLTSVLEVCGLPKLARKQFSGSKGNFFAAFVTNAILVGTALALDHFKIIDRLHLLYA